MEQQQTTETNAAPANGTPPPDAATGPKPKALAMKLVEVMACVDRVAKNGTNETQHYKYAMAADVYDAVRSELARRFVLMVPRLEKWDFEELQTRSGGSQKLCTVNVRFEFTDAETGEVHAVTSIGQGTDTGDKSFYKAMTGATKQCLIQTFLIPTGDDPENEKPEKGATRSGPPAPGGTQALKQRVKSGEANHDRTLSFKFGNNSGKPISDMDLDGLRWYVAALQRDLADASKAQYHDSSRKRLATLQAEIKFREAAPDLDGPARENARPTSREEQRQADRREQQDESQRRLENALGPDVGREIESQSLPPGSRPLEPDPKPTGPLMAYGPKKGHPVASLGGPELLEMLALGTSKVGSLEPAKAAKVTACIEAIKAEQAKREKALLEPGSDLDVD